ncbi:MAG: heme-binding protein [Candidatus Dactylopiibacterium sp.]|nr:heme-binding protein [Candidatus Dactylopiibacterium sp.]
MSTNPLPPRYGAPVTLDEARRVMAAAEAECARQGDWPMVIAIVDSGAHLVMLHALDGAQHASLALAQGKAVTANNFRRATKVFEDAVGAGGIGLRMLSADGVSAIEGGLPLFRDGAVIGAIGVSGMSAVQDGVIAAAGAAAQPG